MADKNQIILELKAKTTKLEADLKKVEKALDGVEKKTKKTTKEKSRLRIATEGARRSLGAMRNNMLLVSFALGGTGAAVGKLVKAYGEQQLAEKKLQQALGFTSKALLTQASALQQTTAFGDEAIIGVQALIGAFTKDEEQIKALTQTTLDLAAAKGMDLTAAADLVSKSFGSSTNALSRYGIQVEGAVGSTERLNNLTGNVAALFGGQASAQADTMTGSIEQMQNALGDTAETMGALLEPSTIAFSKSIKKAAEGWSEFFLELKETEMETAVRQLRDMGAAAEDLALLEQFVLIERHSEAIINNNKKIIEAVHDQNTLYGNRASLSDDELIFLGATIIQREREKNILSSGQIVRERQVVLTEQEKVNEENILFLRDRIAKRNKEIIDGGEESVQQHSDEIKLNAQKMKDLERILILIKQEESARIALTNVGKDDAPSNIGQDSKDEFNEFILQQTAKLDKLTEEKLLVNRLIEEYPKLAESLGLVTDANKKTTDSSLKSTGALLSGLANISKASKASAVATASLQFAAVGANTASAAMAAITPPTGAPTPAGWINFAAVTATGVAQGLQIAQSLSQVKAAQYGMNEVVDEPTMILAGEAGAEQVSITPLESPNIDGVQGGAASVVVNVSGNVLTSDFVEGELADNIREAVRRGTDFGIG